MVLEEEILAPGENWEQNLAVVDHREKNSDEPLLRGGGPERERVVGGEAWILDPHSCVCCMLDSFP